MSLDFELKFDAYKDNDPTGRTGEVSNPDYYPGGGNIRNIAFVWPDGRMQFFNYSYLVTCTCDKGNGTISMEFTTHRVEIKGKRLEQLFSEIMAQVNRVIRCIDKRYNGIADEEKPVVEEITVLSKG